MPKSGPSRVSPAYPARRDRLFHLLMGVAFLLTAIVGFGPTFFFKTFHPSRPLSPLLTVHGLVFTTWLVLLIVQSGLVRADRVDVHKRLGIFGAVLAGLVVALGLLASFDGVRRGTSADGLDALGFMVFPLGQTLLFAGFTGLGIWKRRQPELHRRFILLGTICMMTPAISRMVDKRSVLAMFLTLSFVVVAMIHDWTTRRRVHSIYLWGGALLLISGPLRFALGSSAAWHTFARWLVK